MLISLVVDFDPITAEMGPGTTWHPYNVFSAFAMLPAWDVGLKSKFS
jgi:hypothetical protein